MPFGTFQISPQEAFAHTAKLMVAGAQMVKLEGGAAMVETVRFLTSRGIPVCGHIGLTPQSVHQLGGYRVQGKESAAATKLLEDAVALEQAGAGMIVLEAMPALLAAEITSQLTIPTIGIGAGIHCDGQVLVIHDVLGLMGDFRPKFVKRYVDLRQVISQAVENYMAEVRKGKFPSEEHSFHL